MNLNPDYRVVIISRRSAQHVMMEPAAAGGMVCVDQIESIDVARAMERAGASALAFAPTHLKDRGLASLSASSRSRSMNGAETVDEVANGERHVAIVPAAWDVVSTQECGPSTTQAIVDVLVRRHPGIKAFG